MLRLRAEAERPPYGKIMNNGNPGQDRIVNSKLSGTSHAIIEITYGTRRKRNCLQYLQETLRRDGVPRENRESRRRFSAPCQSQCAAICRLSRPPSSSTPYDRLIQTNWSTSGARCDSVL